MNPSLSRPVMVFSAMMFLLVATAQPASAVTLAYDSFTRPDNTDLNANRSGVDLLAPTNWVEEFAEGPLAGLDLGIVSGRVTPIDTGGLRDRRARNTTMILADGFVGVDLRQDKVPPGDGAGSNVVARAQVDGSHNLYRAQINANTNRIAIEKTVNGVATVLAAKRPAGIVHGVTYRIVLEATGTILRLYKDGVLELSASDATFASGHSGFILDSDGFFADNFKVATTFAEANDPGPPPADTTPPVITPTVTPAPNANGWNKTDVTVLWSVTDPESGIASSIGCGTTVLTAETPGTLLTCSATNGVGLSSSASVTVKIDKTPPEAANQFDPATLEVVVLGRDALSGVPVGPIAPLSVVPTRWGEGREADDPDEPGNAELRTYRIEDAAGNILILVEQVKREGHELKARIVSLQYNTGPVLIPPRNTKAFEWESTKTGTLKELEQQLTLGRGAAEQEVEAQFEAEKNQTTITVEDLVKTKIVQPGLVLLRFVTASGVLRIEF